MRVRWGGWMSNFLAGGWRFVREPRENIRTQGNMAEANSGLVHISVFASTVFFHIGGMRLVLAATPAKHTLVTVHTRLHYCTNYRPVKEQLLYFIIKCSLYIGPHVEAILEPNPGFSREAPWWVCAPAWFEWGKRLFYMGSNAVFGQRLSEWAFALIGRSHMCRFDGEALWHAGSPKHTGRRAFPKYLSKQFTETESKILRIYLYQCVTSWYIFLTSLHHPMFSFLIKMDFFFGGFDILLLQPKLY